VLPQEYRQRKRQRLRARMNEHLKVALQRATLDDSDALEQLMRTKAGAYRYRPPACPWL